MDKHHIPCDGLGLGVLLTRFISVWITDRLIVDCEADLEAKPHHLSGRCEPADKNKLDYIKAEVLRLNLHIDIPEILFGHRCAYTVVPRSTRSFP